MICFCIASIHGFGLIISVPRPLSSTSTLHSANTESDPLHGVRFSGSRPPLFHTSHRDSPAYPGKSSPSTSSSIPPPSREPNKHYHLWDGRVPRHPFLNH